MAEFDILYGEGISKEGAVLDMAVARNIITKSGSWYSYGDLRIAQGRDNVRVHLKENPEMFYEIENKVREDMLGVAEKEKSSTDAAKDTKE